MRSLSSSRLVICFFLLALSFAQTRANTPLPTDAAAKLLPDQVGESRALNLPPKMNGKGLFDFYKPEDYQALSYAERAYVLKDGRRIIVEVAKTLSDSGAYALLTEGVRHNNESSQVVRLNDVGFAGFATSSGVQFYKGAAFVRIYSLAKASDNNEALIDFARLFAATLDKGEGEIPVLVKHLPDWEKAQERAMFAVSLEGLQNVMGHQPALDAIDFTGGTEAVMANYDSSRLLIVEFNTPQLAFDNDARIKAKIKELWASGQSAPTAYRRVGNYAVFVFDAPDEQTAKHLIDSISYEQIVRWLGPNPHAIEEAQRQYVQTTAGVIMSVMKASGLSLILCLGIGGLFGALMFRRRRAQQTTVNAYTDAGGMMRLNLDNITRQNDPARLLGQSS
ncbi:MAG: DUF6599 family protein, partial [Pyrinomonadaceae bacterium]